MEDLLREKNGLYVLPLNQTAKLKWSLHFLFGFMVVVFLGFIMIPGDGVEKMILNILFLVLAFLIGYLWLAMAVIRKPQLTITNEYLEYKWLFGHKVIFLKSIYKTELFSESGIVKFGIWSNEEGKMSFWEITDRMFGRDYSVSIVLSTFQNLDFEKLALTIMSKAESNEKKDQPDGTG
ncbi:hypothetical protein RB620_07760 [Paenibacillus sp. LHD-117]|uniref:hypothetical protein n=1 Tax=Paenibacillus sp. LHD-117 TaxID=3071412 RepID=UPI0027E01596|nr:hypothetical protein [Paenibacillus sp. LHD-117]MDQ6419336.1 hypothetical protein [Paenibacillus sp. LHD-117]